MGNAKNKMKMGKAASDDGATPEMIKYMDQKVKESHFRIIKAEWKLAKSQEIWNYM